MTKERLQYFQDYREKNREKIRAYNKEYNKQWRKKHGYHNEKKWEENHVVQVEAQRTLQRAVKSGKQKKYWCKVCHATKTVAHHNDYSKPLEVVWLCHKHHREVHYGNNRGLKVVKKLSPV